MIGNKCISPLEIFARLDHQNRGTITLPEFLRALQTHSSLCRGLGFKYPLQQRSLEQFTLAFEEMDAEGLGYVDKRRFYAWCHSKKKQQDFSLSTLQEATNTMNQAQSSSVLDIKEDDLDLQFTIAPEIEAQTTNPQKLIAPIVASTPQQRIDIVPDAPSESEWIPIVANLGCEIDRYFKLGASIAQTEYLASNMPTTNLSNQLESLPDPTLLNDEFDQHSTYYYLGNLYAGLPQQFPRRK